MTVAKNAVVTHGSVARQWTLQYIKGMELHAANMLCQAANDNQQTLLGLLIAMKCDDEESRLIQRFFLAIRDGNDPEALMMLRACGACM